MQLHIILMCYENVFPGELEKAKEKKKQYLSRTLM